MQCAAILIVLGVGLVMGLSAGAAEPINAGYDIANLGSINDETAFAWDINDSGTSVGQYEDYDGIWKPCWYSFGWPHNIDDVDAGSGSAWAINVDGRIVGSYGGDAFITDTFGIITAPTASWGGTWSRALGVNGDGDTVGTWSSGNDLAAW